MCDACSRNTWKKVKCWIHCSLSCIQLLSWPVHRWFRGNYTGHIYVLHFFTMKVVWVDPAQKKNTLVSPTRWMDRLPIWFYQEFLPSSADLVTSIFGDVHPLSHLSFAVETIFTCWIKSHVSQWNLRGSSWKVVVHLGNHLKLLQFSHFFPFFHIFSHFFRVKCSKSSILCGLSHGFLVFARPSSKPSRWTRWTPGPCSTPWMPMGITWWATRIFRGRAMGKSHRQPGVLPHGNQGNLWKLRMLNMLCIFMYHVWGKNNVKPLNI